MINNKNILITGATGSIGTYLAESLSFKNKLYCIVRKSSNINKLREFKNIYFIYFEADDDRDDLFQALKDLKIDLIFHLAGKIVADNKYDDIEPLLQSNIVFPSKVLEILLACGYTKIINIGTYAEFHGTECLPSSFYAASKKSFENILTYYVYAHKFVAITVYLYHVFGKNCKSFLRLLDDATANNKSLNLTDGMQLLDLIYIDDVIGVCMKCAEELLVLPDSTEKKYGAYSKNPMSLRKIVAIYENSRNVKLNINWGAVKYRNLEFFSQNYPYSLPAQFTCRYSLLEALVKDNI